MSSVGTVGDCMVQKLSLKISQYYAIINIIVSCSNPEMNKGRRVYLV